jgi:colicin import membrane protein
MLNKLLCRLFVIAASVMTTAGCASNKPPAKPIEPETASLSSFSKNRQAQRSSSGLKEDEYSFPKRLRSAIKPNIIFDNKSDDNSATELLVRINKDSKVISVQLELSSGNVEWDKAVIAAVWKTEFFPKDIDGTVHPKLLLVFRPKD